MENSSRSRADRADGPSGGDRRHQGPQPRRQGRSACRQALASAGVKATRLSWAQINADMPEAHEALILHLTWTAKTRSRWVWGTCFTWPQPGRWPSCCAGRQRGDPEQNQGPNDSVDTEAGKTRRAASACDGLQSAGRCAGPCSKAHRRRVPPGLKKLSAAGTPSRPGQSVPCSTWHTTSPPESGLGKIRTLLGPVEKNQKGAAADAACPRRQGVGQRSAWTKARTRRAARTGTLAAFTLLAPSALLAVAVPELGRAASTGPCSRAPGPRTSATPVRRCCGNVRRPIDTPEPRRGLRRPRSTPLHLSRLLEVGPHCRAPPAADGTTAASSGWRIATPRCAGWLAGRGAWSPCRRVWTPRRAGNGRRHLPRPSGPVSRDRSTPGRRRPDPEQASGRRAWTPHPPLRGRHRLSLTLAAPHREPCACNVAGPG